MINRKSRVFVSTKDFEHKNISIDDLINNQKNCFVLTRQEEQKEYWKNKDVQSIPKTFSFVNIDSVEEVSYGGDIIQCEFENSWGKRYILEVTPQCNFITARGVTNVLKINDLDVFYDIMNLPCKLTKKDKIADTAIEAVSITPLYNRNFFCNEILVAV